MQGSEMDHRVIELMNYSFKTIEKLREQRELVTKTFLEEDSRPELVLHGDSLLEKLNNAILLVGNSEKLNPDSRLLISDQICYMQADIELLPIEVQPKEILCVLKKFVPLNSLEAQIDPLVTETTSDGIERLEKESWNCFEGEIPINATGLVENNRKVVSSASQAGFLKAKSPADFGDIELTVLGGDKHNSV